MNEESKNPRTKSKYHVVVFGQDLIDAPMGGEVKVFDFKNELSEWLTSNRIQEHVDAELRDQGVLQDASGRSVVVIRGQKTTLKTTVSIE